MAAFGTAVFGTDIFGAGITYWVSTTGSDAAAGSFAAPWRTIGHAAATVAGGSVVRVLPGTYAESIFITSGAGSVGAHTIYVSDTKWAAKVTGDGTGNPAFQIRTVNYVDIQGFEITNVSGSIAVETYTTGNRIVGNHVHACTANVAGGAGIHITNITSTAANAQADNWVLANVVHDVGNYLNAGGDLSNHGIYVTEPGTTVQNNIVYRNSAWGIHFWHWATNEVCSNNTVFENGAGGIVMGANPGEGTNNNSTTANNISRHNGINPAVPGPVGGTGRYGISEEGSTGSANQYLNNLVYQNSPGDIRIIGGGTQAANVTADPLFVNWQGDGSGDYHLLASSPAVNAGTSTSASTTDSDGLTRPQGVAYDIGAYERLTALWNLVQHNALSTSAATTTFAITLPANLVAGNRLILRASTWYGTPTSTISAVTDNRGNTWNGPLIRKTDADGGDHTIWDAVVSNSGGLVTVTATLSGGASGDNNVTLFLQEYSGLSTATSSYTDGSVGATGATANAASGASSPVPALAGELAIGYIADSGRNDASLASGSGWTQVNRVVSNVSPEGVAEDQNTVAGVGSNASSASATGAWAAMVVVFKLAAAAADVTAPSIPGGLTANAIDSGKVTLAWSASSDNVGVAGYTVYRGLGVSRDLHLNGPEFGLSTVSGATGSFSNLNPGTIDSQYHYDGQASFNYVAGRGYRRVKLPIRWERIQPTLNAALNAAELTRLTSCLDRINAAGLKVILDVHNYGIYYKDATPLTAPGLVASGSGSTLLAGTYTMGCTWWNSSDSSLSATAQITISAGQNIVMTSTGVPSTISSVNFWLIAAPATTSLGYLSGAGIGGGTASYTLTSRTQGTGGSAPGTGIGRAITLGDSELTVAAFSDLWTRLATAFKTHGAIANGGAYCIMTEPQNSQGLTAVTWKTASQAAVTAIRAVDAATCIHVCGFNWANTRNWAGINGGGTWITDPSNNLRYEAHCYFDDQVGGQYSNTYAQEVTNATNAGFTAGSNLDAEHSRIRADISSFQSWLTTNGVRGVLGEIGWPNTPSGEQAQWNALGNVILADCDTNAIETVVWQGGEWSTDKLTVYTGGFGTISTANAQAATSEAHHSFVTPQLSPSAGVSYNDLSVLPSTTYLYSVDAYDAAGNHSPQSAWASATTPAVVVAPPPTVPGWPRLVRVSIPFN